ncbi:MAG TPA: methyl-accepting chemotaxis protein [Desulfotomaculum sp.]|nr:MAG: hypothetical protein JL56_05920 [Desulfotomaculum sp. BICA1-6]HBX23972.1 methyl-accepting chemotaxis protein [Desulfotomaculum sp.]
MKKKKNLDTLNSIDILNVRRSLKIKFAAVTILVLLLGAPVSHFIISFLSRLDLLNGILGVYINTVINIAVVTIVLTLMLNRMVIRPFNNLIQKLKQMSEGDLTVELVHKSGDEVGQLYAQVSILKESIKDIIGKINGGTEKVTIASASLKNMMGEAMESLQVISSAMQQVSASIQQTAADTQAMSSFSEQVSAAVDSGKQNMSDSVTHLDKIKEDAGESVNLVKQLEHQSKEITGIIEVINGIAEQTNLLALNAAIEAARAGEHGKGFAVVAEEVRVLAEQSKKSAGEIVALVEQIKRKVNETADFIENNGNAVNEGAQKINNLNINFNIINEAIEELGTRIQGIAGAVEEVGASTEEVSASSHKELNAIGEVNKMAESLNGTAQELKESVNRFKI